MSRSCGERANAGTRRRNGAGSLFGENGKSEKRRDYMKSNPYKNLPSLERKSDGTPYRMTPAQRKRANALIRRECCNCEGGNCIALDAGDTCTCPQTVSFTVCCKWFRWAVLPLDKALEAELDGRKQELVKQIAELTVEAISPEQVNQISGYLDTWDSVSFDDKRRVVDLMITTVAATSDSLNITWKI